MRKYYIYQITTAFLLSGAILVAEPIHDAAMYGDIEAFKAELNKGVDVNLMNQFGETPLDLALWLSDENEISNHIRNSGGRTSEQLLALLNAVRTGNIEDAKNHLSDGVDVNIKNFYGDTAIHKAVKLNRIKFTELLLSNDADINLSNYEKWTPLHTAVSLGYNEMVRILLSNGAYVNVKLDDGSTPLHLAVWYGRTEIAETLIASGAKLNSKNQNGWTPLHIATEADLLRLAELLVKEGADILEEDTNGKNPLDLAISLNRADIADFYSKQLIPEPPSTSEPILRLVLEKSNFSIRLDTIAGMNYVIESTQDFQNWNEFKIAKGTGKRIEFNLDSEQLTKIKNFYRVKVVD